MAGEGAAVFRIWEATMIAIDVNRSTNDVELERRVLNYLHQRFSNLTELEVEARDGRVILRGIVSYPHIQRRCIDCCRSVAGVLDVIDRLIVSPSQGLNGPEAEVGFVTNKPR
jgi:osmotically-inducible protein OsmY